MVVLGPVSNGPQCSTGRKYILQPPEVCAKVRKQYEQDFYPGRYEWPAFLRYLDRVEPDYAD